MPKLVYLLKHPLDAIDLLRHDLFHEDRPIPQFEHLRRMAPVHYTADHPRVGSFWSVTRYKEFMAVDTDHELFSS